MHPISTNLSRRLHHPRTAIAATFLVAFAPIAGISSPSASAEALPPTSARIDGRELAATSGSGLERIGPGDQVRHFIDPDLGAITTILRIDGPPPIRDGGREMAQASLAGPYWITGVCIMNNTQATTQLMGATYPLPVSDPSIIIGGGSAVGFLLPGIQPNGATFSVGPAAGVEFIVDGAAVAELLSVPFAISTPLPPALIGPQSWGEPIPNRPIPAPVAGIAVTVSALVTSGDTAVMTFTFVVT